MNCSSQSKQPTWPSATNEMKLLNRNPYQLNPVWNYAIVRILNEAYYERKCKGMDGNPLRLQSSLMRRQILIQRGNNWSSEKLQSSNVSCCFMLFHVSKFKCWRQLYKLAVYLRKHSCNLYFCIKIRVFVQLFCKTTFFLEYSLV